ncbi:MAG: permease-like cell division protein FtsX [Clostridia bacterium]
MRNFTRNTGYFLGEVKTIFFLNGLSGILSILSLVFIFFIALLALSGWWISTDLVNALKKEAEISIYYQQDLEEQSLAELEAALLAIEGITSVRHVTAEEAYDMMTGILGQEAGILSNFEENPFEAYYEMRIELGRLESILPQVKDMNHVTYIRDNQDILGKLRTIAQVVTALGIVVVLAVGATTFIITSHIIREGIHSHSAHIVTLKLFGAPGWFVNLPFVLEGLLLSFIAGLLSIGMFFIFVHRFSLLLSGTLTFLPFINMARIQSVLSLGVLTTGLLMGFLASLFSLKLVRKK